MWPCDSRRYGEFATRRYSARKVEEAYEHTYRLPKPGEELPAARPLKTTPIHDLLAQRGAVFGAVYGWERPNWYAPEGVEPVDIPSFYRPNYFEYVGDECRSARERVGVADASHAARLAVTGPGAAAMLNRVLCTRLPEPGGVATGYALSSLGTVRSEFTVVREAEERFLLISAPGAERYDLDLLHEARPGHAAVQVENLTGREAALAVFGPQASALIAEVTQIPHAALSNADVMEATVGYAPARLVRSSVGGEEGWQIQLLGEYLRHAFVTLLEADAAATMRLVGARALDCMRLEAGTPAWGTDLGRAFSALESGLEPFIDFEKDGYRGREPLLRQKETGLERRLVRLEVSGNETFDAMGQEPLRRLGGKVVGRTTSGGFGHCLGRSLAIAYVDAGLGRDANLEVKLMNEWFPARILQGA